MQTTNIERLKAQHESAFDEVYRLMNTGAFVISERAAQVLAELDKRDRSTAQWSPDYFAAQARAYANALAAMRAEADLGVN